MALLELQQFGGTTSVSEDSVFYTAPTAPFALQLVSLAINASLEELARETIKEYNNLSDVYTGEVSFNFLRGDQQDRLQDAFSKANLALLKLIKSKYDPRNFFSNNINILPNTNN